MRRCHITHRLCKYHGKDGDMEACHQCEIYLHHTKQVTNPPEQKPYTNKGGYSYNFSKLEVLLITAALESLGIYIKRADQPVRKFLIGALMDENLEIEEGVVQQAIDNLQHKLAAGVAPDEEHNAGQEISLLHENPTVGPDAPTGAVSPERSNQAKGMPPE